MVNDWFKFDEDMTLKDYAKYFDSVEFEFRNVTVVYSAGCITNYYTDLGTWLIVGLDVDTEDEDKLVICVERDLGGCGCCDNTVQEGFNANDVELREK